MDTFTAIQSDRLGVHPASLFSLTLFVATGYNLKQKWFQNLKS